MKDENKVKELISKNKELKIRIKTIRAQIRELSKKSFELQEEVIGNMFLINYYASETTIHEDGSSTTTIPLVIE